MSVSNNPQVFGLVIITPAKFSSMLSLKSLKSIRPLSFDFIVLTSNPRKAAVAGLVPCAESGTKTTFLFSSFLSNNACLIAIIPHNSP